MRTLIIYKSKYGSTKQYAQWIHDEIESDIVSVNDKKKLNFDEYDNIIFASYFYVYLVAIAPFIIRNWKKIKDKRIVLITTSGTPPDDAVMEGRYKLSFPKRIANSMTYFPLDGRIDRGKIKIFDKFSLMMGVVIERDPAIKKRMRVGFDGVRKENIIPVIESINRE